MSLIQSFIISMCRHLRWPIQFAVRKYKLAYVIFLMYVCKTILLMMSDTPLFERKLRETSLFSNNTTCAFLIDGCFYCGFHFFLQTVLHWAAKHGNEDIVKLFAGKYKANINAKTVGLSWPVSKSQFSKFFLFFILRFTCATERGE